MVIPSIDLMGGKVVQLRQGREKILEAGRAQELIREFDRFGETAVIDLDAALNRGENRNLIREILKLGDCRAGGGIRDVATAKDFLRWGARKIIVGSQAFAADRINRTFLAELSADLGRDRIIVAIDSRQGRIVTRGWTRETGLEILKVVPEIEPYCAEFLFTCVEREGCLQGTDISLVRELVRQTRNRITVAGGIAARDEIRELSRLGVNCQLGMALYTERIGLADAFSETVDWDKGLIPTVTQDETGQVLTLAYSNRESLQNVFTTGQMWYFSRSRNRLWRKGETSGHAQELLKIRTDCDGDALLARVRQKGCACHNGSYSCFGGMDFSLPGLLAIVRDRLADPRPGSYTAGLNDDLLREKIREEAEEVTRARTRDEVVWEAADVLYFLTVLLAKSGIGYDDVLRELAGRRWK
jgi:phosphoribosyl-ATP pyrophosphohydrolase/phosphoribosyl-AMP cyclohydrolase